MLLSFLFSPYVARLEIAAQTTFLASFLPPLEKGALFGRGDAGKERERERKKEERVILRESNSLSSLFFRHRQHRMYNSA